MVYLSPQTSNLVTIILGALFSLSPLWNYGVVYNTDDAISLYRETDSIASRNPSLLASLFVVLIPAADLFLDLPSHIYDHLHSKKLPCKKVKSEIFRLDDFERFLFIIGVSIQSSVFFLPMSADLSTFGTVYSSTTNASVLLVLGPILTYLSRCTTTFTPARTFGIVTTATMGNIILTIGTLSQPYTNSNLMKRIGTAIVGSSGVFFVLLIAVCAYKYCALPSHQQSLITLLSNLNPCERLPVKTDGATRQKKKDGDNELYTNYIPGLHMATSAVIIFYNVYLAFLVNSNKLVNFEMKNYIVIASQIMVLVIELRIRKNEITRGLIALLESKKSYVRHISHELRTPLNTAFLGLKLLTTDLKSSKNPKDMERYDTLCDVNMSCTAAVDILNDLLCYEKLESGILELHKENIFVEPFLRDCAAMFSAQARECGVNISTVIENTGNSNIPSLDGKVSRSLLPDDAIYADKFKMDQVIRNLVSNALKFTPRGGNVTIKASFVHDACDDHMGSSSEPMKTSSRSQNSSSRIQSGSKRINISTFLHRSNRCVLAVLDQASECNMSPIRGQLVVVVTDTGAGISKENQARLFNEIVQFSPEKLQAGGGSGLGLWITQEILNLHDGSISVSSEGEGMGSSFTMRMPMTREPPISVSADVASSPFPIHLPELESYMEDESNRSDGDGLRSVLAYRSSSNNLSVTDHGHSICSERVPRPFEVLVVDDSRMCRKMLLKCLRADGHTCFEAEDGLEAIAMVKERVGHANGSLGKPFDAVLMDFIMPNMDGPTATQEIRALGYTAPIFGVTGNGLPSDIAHFLAHGADRVLLKPLDINAFSNAIHDMEDDDMSI